MVVRRVQRWHEEGVSIDHAMFWLCTYLGHAKISDTYWYLTGTPELMELVGAQFDRFVLLLRFAERTLGKPAFTVELSDLKPTFIASFLDHLEHDRGNSPRSRNVRLAALRSFLKFAARRDIANLSVIERALGRADEAIRPQDGRLPDTRACSQSSTCRPRPGLANAITCC